LITIDFSTDLLIPDGLYRNESATYVESEDADTNSSRRFLEDSVIELENDS
jgi:hypothetical protein